MGVERGRTAGEQPARALGGSSAKRGASQPVSVRDLQLLAYVGDQYAVTMPQLARLCDRSFEAARSLTRRWKRLGLVEAKTLVAHEPPVVWLTRAGQRACGLSYRPWQPRPGTIAHVAAATEVRMYVQGRRPHAVWLSERRLAHEGSHRGHRPDAVVLAEGYEIPVEVELSVKTRRRTLEIASELLADYPFIWYFASPDCRPLLDELALSFDPDVIQVLEIPSAS